MLLDKATKSKLQFNLRCQAKPKDLQQLDWYTTDFQNSKGENEIRFLATKVANRQIASNLLCNKGVFSWKIPPTVPKVEEKKPVEPKKEEVKPEVKPEAKKPEPTEQVNPKDTNFFDEDDSVVAPPKPLEPKKDAKQEVEPAKEPKDQKDKSKEVPEDSAKEDFFDDFEEVDDQPKTEAAKAVSNKVPVPKRKLTLTEIAIVVSKIAIRFRRKFLKKWKKPHSLIIYKEFFTDEDTKIKIFYTATLKGADEVLAEATDVTNNKPFKPLLLKKSDFKHDMIGFDVEGRALFLGTDEEEAHEEMNKSAISNKSVSSVVSRRSCIFQEKPYTISAHKYSDTHKVKLRVVSKGGTEVANEIEIEHKDAEDDEQLTKLAREDLKMCALESDGAKGVKILRPLQLSQIINFEDPNQLLNIFASFIKARPQPVYTEHIKDDYYWYLTPEDGDKLRISLVKRPELEPDYLDFYCTNEDSNIVRTDAEYKTIVERFYVNWAQESPHIEEKSTAENHEGEEEFGAEEQEEEDDFGFGDNKPKYEVVVERTREDQNIVEVTSVRIKDKNDVDRVKLKCVFNEHGEIGENEKNIEYIKRAWEADQKTGMLQEKNNNKSGLEDEDGEGKFCVK